MSRCIVCDVKLSEDELRNKDLETGAYLDTCYSCLGDFATDMDELMLEHTGYGDVQ